MFVLVIAGLLLTIQSCTKWDQLQESASASPASAVDPWSIMRGKGNQSKGEPHNGGINTSLVDAEAKTTGRRWVDCEFYVCRLTV